MILQRTNYLPNCVMGRLLFAGRHVYTIERPWLQNIPYESCIPDGVYDLRPFSGARFQDVWEVCDVPGRSAILIHAANWPHELHGCIAPGLGWRINEPGEDPKRNMVTSSRRALDRVFDHIAQQAAPTLTVMSAAATL